MGPWNVRKDGREILPKERHRTPIAWLLNCYVSIIAVLSASHRRCVTVVLTRHTPQFKIVHVSYRLQTVTTSLYVMCALWNAVLRSSSWRFLHSVASLAMMLRQWPKSSQRKDLPLERAASDLWGSGFRPPRAAQHRCELPDATDAFVLRQTRELSCVRRSFGSQA